ncbi:hypothetical protein F4780DRAFT_749190 [Xylariomycetidae sp. FL0641]|nr:hypothetical protein F4780DRAFT_749190 [Xylariomycetidae sp. FL0641]
MVKTLKLGERLHYPITISKFYKKAGDDVVKKEAILQYTFKFERTVGDPTIGEEHTIQETGIADWDSPTEGKIKQWRLKEGQVITRDQDCVTVEETCGHEVQYAGLCAVCGKDMKESNWASDSLDTSRATVAMVHDNVALTVSQSQAERAEIQLQRRLLKERKLSLVVDLDQTIIHACIEPTIGEWQRDPSNPNYEAVKDVRSFQLDDGPRGLTSGCWYYIKMRPGLSEFLEKIAELFELHVYTMGTRAYALNIAKIVDPTQKLFGNRVISRDENGSMTAKSLQRLFPVSTNMVVVIDDRADVWPKNRSNLIKVTPYDFFKGIGDINSSFLPKREDIIAASPVPEPKPAAVQNATPVPNGAAKSDVTSEHEKAVANNSDENALLQLQAEEQERTLEKQIKDRPLLHLQEELDKEDGETGELPPQDNDSMEVDAQEKPESTPHQRHHLLRDDDEELKYLEKHLANLHQSFYEQYDARSAKQRLEDLRPDIVPDVGSTLNFLKSQVLKNTKIVLSGLVPLGTDVRKSEIGMHAASFGADIRTRISEDVTHLVISSSRPRTQKVRQAARIPSIKIVNQDWLADSLAQWRKLEETPYLIQIHPSDRSVPTLGEEASEGSVSPPRPRITIVQSGQPVFEQGQNEEAEDGDADDSANEEDDDDGEEDEDGEIRDRFNVMPADLRDGEHSPVEELNAMGWDDMDKELEEFMGSDAGDSDFDSTVATDREMDTDNDEPSRNKKRKMGDDEDGVSSATEDGSALAKKQRIAKARTTGLRNVKNIGEQEEVAEGSGLPTPMGTGDEGGAAAGEAPEEDAEEEEQDDDNDDDGDDDDEFADLEAELEAELEAGGQG